MINLRVSALVVLFAIVNLMDDASASMLGMGAGMIGAKVPPACEKLVNEESERTKNEVYEKYIKEHCKKAKCKPTYEVLKLYYGQVKSTAEEMFKTTGKDGLTPHALDGECKSLQADLNAILWKEIDKIVEKCILKAGSPGEKELKGQDLCTLDKEKMKQTGECVKGEVVPLALNKFGMKMDQVKKCFNQVLDKYCNEKFLKKWFRYFVDKVKEDRKLLGKWNYYNAIDTFFKDCKDHHVS